VSKNDVLISLIDCISSAFRSYWRFSKTSSFFLDLFLFIMKKSLKSASNIMWNFSDFIFMSINKTEKYCEILTSRKLNLSILNVFSVICLMMLTKIEWFVNIIVSDFLELLIKCFTFLTIHTTSVISSSMSQYLVFAEMRILLKNMINSIFARLKIMSSSEFSFTWKIMTSNSFFLKMSTSMKSLRWRSKCLKKLSLLMIDCKCSYDLILTSVDSFNDVFLTNNFRAFSFIESFLRRRIFLFCKNFNACEYHETYTRKYLIKFKYVSNSFNDIEKTKFVTNPCQTRDMTKRESLSEEEY
jgi:hypothetical protein